MLIKLHGVGNTLKLFMNNTGEILSLISRNIHEKFEDNDGKLEDVNRRIYNVMAKIKRTKGQTMIFKRYL